MKNRIIALAAAAIMAAQLCGCAKKDTEPVDMTTVTQGSETSGTSAAVQDTAPDVFGDSYDPFDEGYDPYGDNSIRTTVNENAVTAVTEGTSSGAVVTAAPARADETRSTVKPKETEATPAQTQSVSPGASPDSADSESLSSQSGVTGTVKETGGWNDGTADFKQFDVTVQNNSKKTVNGWQITFPIGAAASVEQSWNCELSVSGGVFTAGPVDFNTNIDPGQNASFGIIVKNPSPVKAGDVKVECTLGAPKDVYGSGSNGGAVTSPAKDVPAPTTDDWLSVKGNRIVDQSGNEVWITGINWFGYNTGTNTFDGLWACDLNTSIAEIANHGFNLLRVPMSAELINSWAKGTYPEANFNHATNAYLVDMNSLEIFDYVVGQCRANGLKIMIDIHSAKTDAMGHMANVWYNGDVTEADYLAALSWMADRYKNDDTVIAYDLKNEPHGKANETPRAKWDNSRDKDNWKYIAEKAAKAVLDKNPNVLVMVEGIEIYPKSKDNADFSSTSPADYYSTWWGGNLRGVKDYPIDLGKYQNKLVYSPHDYGPAVYEQEWFKGDYSYESLKRDAWNDNWLYIHDEGIAPILIGEWGGFMTQPNLKWMKLLRQLIKEKRLNHTFWCFNANSGDTGGLVKDDFVTWDEEKYAFVKEVLWQKNGKFAGLDHQIPLGENGTTLS